MKKTSFAAFGLILALTLCIFGACTKTDAAKAAGGTEQKTVGQVVYVAPAAGLNLREGASAAGKLIKTLPQNTRLVVLEKGQNEETVSGATGFWYRVDTGKEAGWVFGAHITTTAPAAPRAQETPKDDVVKIDESKLCTRSFPLELELVFNAEGLEERHTARRAISSRYGYAIYLLEGFKLQESGKQDVITRDTRRNIPAEDTFEIRIYEANPRTPIPADKGLDKLGVWSTYQRVAVWNRTLEAEFNYWFEAAGTGYMFLDAMFRSIRPVK